MKMSEMKSGLGMSCNVTKRKNSMERFGLEFLGELFVSCVVAGLPLA